jgi:glycosyltransferase involved in cell wall biosynthesis
MKILMLFQYPPLPPPLDLAGTKRNLPFLRENLKHHEVSVLSYGTLEDKKKFDESVGKVCKRVVFVDAGRPLIMKRLVQLWLLVTGRSTFRLLYRKKMQRHLDELISLEKFDLIHCCTQLFGYFRFPNTVPVVSDTHEVTYNLMYRTYKQTRNILQKLFSFIQYKLGKREELRICQKFDAIIATTERDKEVLHKDLLGQEIFVVNNGVDPSFLEYQQVEPEQRTMVFTGLMSYYPNNHGILYFLERIFPLVLSQVPDARLYIVGANPSKELRKRRSSRVIVTGYVVDVRPYIARAQVFIIPLLIGGGIRGKALEAMAMRKPIVSTSIGCEGIDLKHESSALFADTPEDFAASVVRLFNDQALRAKLAQRGHENVVARYDWMAKGKELEHLYQIVRAKSKAGLTGERVTL